MNILAFDTSSPNGAVGLWREGLLPLESSFTSKENYSGSLLPEIDSLLRLAQMDVEEVDLFGVVTGPGSFTGIRVGLATAKGLAWSHNKPVVGINSLEVLCANVPEPSTRIAPMLDARKGRVYAALYRTGEPLECLEAAADVDPIGFLRRSPGPVLCLGSGARRYEKELRESFGETLLFANEEADRPRGEVIVRFALKGFQKRGAQEARHLDPVYLRASEAELKKGAHA